MKKSGRQKKSHPMLGYYDPAHRWRFRRYQQLLKRVITDDAVVVDIGCGDGTLLASLPKCVKIGIEANQLYLQQISGEARGHCLLGGVGESLPLGDGVADVVTCTEVIEHVIDPQAMLREVRRVLKPGGLFLVSTYNHYNFFNVLTGAAFSPIPRFPTVHVREYSWKTFRAQIAGEFEIVEEAQASSATWLEKLLERLGWKLGDFMIILASSV